ncbi:ATP-binding protein [Phenylobacterium sp.]|uniref:ATP-binding protein n=1 Tax=Phenylobacterium sp. TaxID=1871053 RepID=UPI002CD270B2|nr:ATP-binding protein [Phenylobacterium sp.]HVI31925.1 ATP-binding protein [Phenylobacterium sp.]
MPRNLNYHEVAAARARQFVSRLSFSALIAVAAAYVVGPLWPAAWMAAVVATQALNHWAGGPLRRSPDLELTAGREAFYLATVVLNAAAFGAIAPLCWFDGGMEGRLFALVILMGGMLNVTIQGQVAPRLLVAGCGPFALLLAGLPLVSALTEPNVRLGAMGFLVVGALTYVGHLIMMVRRTQQTSQALRKALRGAKTERLRAESANAAKSEFLTVMSHEIRTPLNGVLGMAQAMAADELPERQRQRLEVVRQSGEVLLTLLNDLLDLSKIEAAKLELEDGRVDLTELGAQADAAFQGLAGGKGVTLKVWVSEGAVGLRRGDPMRVRQVLYNLIGNAVKFTDQGRVAARITASGEEVVIEVADTGPGISPDRLATLFERFNQGDASNARRYGGSGLGLSISRGLTRLMGGDIAVHSVVGHGSTFTARLRLPETGEGAAASPATGVSCEAPVAEPGVLRILAAEDNATNRLVLKTLLEQVGLAADFVEDGEQALEAWRTARWDVILMDIQMPQMDGVAATREIRRLEADLGLARTPIVALTANAMAHQLAEYTAAGMDALSPKPIQLPQLIATLEQVLAQAQAGAADEAA